jgi:hypothetical protein
MNGMWVGEWVCCGGGWVGGLFGRVDGGRVEWVGWWLTQTHAHAHARTHTLIPPFSSPHPNERPTHTPPTKITNQLGTF